jgi:UTP--glucose-1-phosphate uridylyltransferase
MLPDFPFQKKRRLLVTLYTGVVPMPRQVKKAVFPVAGLGTRFLPATKAMPKELLPIIDKPLIQYAVEEAIAAGITELIFVTGRAKRAVEDHFDSNFELEYVLASKGKTETRDMVRNIVPPGVDCIFVRQPEAMGLGHAVLCAQSVVGREPFLVILADDVLRGETLGSEQLIRSHHRKGGTILSLQEVAPDQVSSYGIVQPGAALEHDEISVAGLVEKPAIGKAPSHLASIGRYLLEPEVFDVLRHLPPGFGGELQLADAINVLAQQGSVRGVPLTSHRYDCGSKFGYLEAIVDFALSHPDFGEPFAELLHRHVEFRSR